MKEELALKELFMQFSRVTQSLSKHHNFALCFLYPTKTVFVEKSFRALVADAYLKMQLYLHLKKSELKQMHVSRFILQTVISYNSFIRLYNFDDIKTTQLYEKVSNAEMIEC